MTEDEAKTKWCPFTRVAQSKKIGPSYNRIDDDRMCEGTNCIASACMAWRWDFDDTQVKRVTNKGGGSYYTSADLPLLDGQTEERVCTRGSCGLTSIPVD